MPLPAMLEIIDSASSNNKKCLLIIIKRGYDDLLIDKSLINYEVRSITTIFESKIGRLLSFFSIIPYLFKSIVAELKFDGVVMTSNFDTLFQASIIRLFRRFEIRHQIRDLNKLQLDKGLIPSLIQFIEKNLLRRVTKLIISSPSFATKYYSKIFQNETIVLENIPRKDVWTNFRKKELNKDSFNIGFIGILRYKKSIKKLIQAVEELEDIGINVKVNFSGGSIPDDLTEIKSYIKKSHLFNFSGPFQYKKDIQRLYSDIDLIFAVYDEYDLNCKIALPNKLYESMITKIPILVAKNTYVGSIVEELRIGETISIEKEDLLLRLKEIFYEKESWYTNSLEKLKKFDTKKIYNDYDKAILKSIN